MVGQWLESLTAISTIPVVREWAKLVKNNLANLSVDKPVDLYYTNNTVSANAVIIKGNIK